MTQGKHLFFIAAAALLPHFAQADSCSLGKDIYGHVTVNLGDTALSSYSDLNDAIAEMGKLRNAGACYGGQGCSLGKDIYGHVTVKLGDTALESYSALDDAIGAYSRLNAAGVCEMNSSCSLGKDIYGHITVIAGGTALASYSSLDDAVAELGKLANSGACGPTSGADGGNCLVAQEPSGVSIHLKRDNRFIGFYPDMRTAQMVRMALSRAGVCR